MIDRHVEATMVSVTAEHHGGDFVHPIGAMVWNITILGIQYLLCGSCPFLMFSMSVEI